MWKFFDKYGQARSTAVAGAGTIAGQIPVWDGDSYEPVLPAMIRLDSQTLGADAASITVNVGTLGASYRHLLIFFDGAPALAGPNYMYMRYNGSTVAQYDGQFQHHQAGTTTSAETAAEDKHRIAYGYGFSNNATARFAGEVRLLNFNATRFKSHVYHSTADWSGGTLGSAGRYVQEGGGLWRNTAAITSVTIFHATGDLKSNFQVSLYGLA